MGLKSRLILAFISIILLPIFSVIGVFAFFSNSMDETTEQQNEEILAFNHKINDAVLNHYQQLDNPEEFNKIIEPIIDSYNVEIIVRSEDNTILFDSASVAEGESYPYMLRQSQVQALNGDILDIEIKSDSIDLAATQSYQQIIRNIVIGIGSGLLVLIILIFGWVIYISRSILRPLKQVYIATEEMQEGNFDYDIIDYNKKDEIGRFINGFNLMRYHLKQSFAKQRKYEKNRKELIANISHDLRTPLQSIKGYVEGINDGIVQNEEMKKKYLQVILAKTEQLDRLIDNLFEFSKIDLDRFIVEKRLVNSEDFFSELLVHIETELEQKGIKLLVKKSIPSLIMPMDPMRIEQVLTNLIDNARRYGGTIVEIGTEEVKEEGTLVVKIRDNGNGIAPEDIPNIFDRFYRGEKSRSREHGGTGLGLAIVKSIIEAHDGTITVHSEEGVGSEFIFTLPVINETD